METISLNQIGLYNPQRQSAEVTEKLFVVRQKQFELLLNKIVQEKENSIPQHYLIIGQRGMGKTTILKRMEVELHKEQYRQQFIPLLFREEQYNVKDLAEFWLNSLDALADSLEFEKYPKEIFEIIDKKTKELSQKNVKTISEEAYRFLMNTCRDLHRRPVLLIDNIGLVFSRLDINSKTKQEQYSLRKLLCENAAPIVIGAGVTVTDDVINYGMPFYDFFQIQYLKKLNYEEFSTLLKNLATVTNCDKTVFTSLQKNTPRQKSLLELTGGSPRTTVMLFKHIVKGFSADINDDLEALADEITPLYKAKFEELPTQQQLILDAIAMNWDAISLRKLAAKTGMQNNQLSPQLKRLTEEGWIETTPAYKSKGNAYFISERFFNIWYLVRNSARRYKEKIYCLSKFLECFYDKEDLERMSDGFLQKDICLPKDIWYGYALVETLKNKNRKKALQIEDKTYSAALELSKNNNMVCDNFDIPEKYTATHKEYKHKKQDTKSTDENTPFEWLQKGWEFRNKQEYDKAIECYDKAIELNPEDEGAWLWKGNVLGKLQNYEESLACYDKILELNPKNEYAWRWKGAILAQLQRYEESLMFYDKVIELNPQYVTAWILKGNALIELQRYEESLTCYDKVLELNPEDAIAWNNKGYILIELHSYEKATDALEESVSIEPFNLSPKFLLLFLYRDKLDKMERAVELFDSIDEKEINQNENKIYACCFYLNKTLFELYKQNKGIATDYLLQAFEVLEKENKLSSMSNDHWWITFGSVVVKLGYGTWLLAILEDKGYDIVLSPYYAAIQVLKIEKQDGQKDAETYLKNRAVEISEPARLIVEKMRRYLD
jgi:Flp pilus assembly protein TadD, contains TPR repeats